MLDKIGIGLETKAKIALFFARGRRLPLFGQAGRGATGRGWARLDMARLGIAWREALWRLFFMLAPTIGLWYCLVVVR